MFAILTNSGTGIPERGVVSPGRACDNESSILILIFRVYKFHFITFLWVVLGLMIPAEFLVADELDIVIHGLEEPALSNVRSRVEPFRITGNARLSRRRRGPAEQCAVIRPERRREGQKRAQADLRHATRDGALARVAVRSSELRFSSQAILLPGRIGDRPPPGTLRGG